MSGVGICNSLIQLAHDEGGKTTLRKAEQWRDILEDLCECGNPEQQKMSMELLAWVNAAIVKLVELGKTKPQPQPADTAFDNVDEFKFSGSQVW